MTTTSTDLTRLGWNDHFSSQLQRLPEAQTLTPARVSIAHADRFQLIGARDPIATLSGRLRREIAGDPIARPGVGDWVGLRAGVIQHVFARTSQLVRKAAGRESRPQLIAANVDTVFVVTAADQPLNPRRLERYLAAIWGGGAQPALVQNKIDLVGDSPADIEASTRAELGPVAQNVPIVAVSGYANANIEPLLRDIEVGQTAAFVGLSGVGKSTLVNRLLGQPLQRTGDTRAGDGKGRHTTTHRELFVLDSGRLLIDSPGMREFGLWDADEGLSETFEDVSSLAERCRFRDCTHQGEPGCAVRDELDPDRLASFRKLQREDRYEARRRDERSRRDDTKTRWKQITKSQRQRRKHDPKLRTD